MNKFGLVYKFPEEEEEHVIYVEGDTFTDGWVRAGYTEKALQELLKLFPPRKNKEVYRDENGNLVDRKRKIEKWLYMFWISGPGPKLTWLPPSDKPFLDPKT